MTRRPTTRALREEAIKQSRDRCAICGRSLEGGKLAQLHHIVPIGNGGSNSLQNLQVLCPNCHRLAHMAGYIANPSRTLANIWISAFAKAPWTTVGASIFAVIAG